MKYILFVLLFGTLGLYAGEKDLIKPGDLIYVSWDNEGKENEGLLEVLTYNGKECYEHKRRYIVNRSIWNCCKLRVDCVPWSTPGFTDNDFVLINKAIKAAVDIDIDIDDFFKQVKTVESFKRSIAASLCAGYIVRAQTIQNDKKLRGTL